MSTCPSPSPHTNLHPELASATLTHSVGWDPSLQRGLAGSPRLRHRSAKVFAVRLYRAFRLVQDSWRTSPLPVAEIDSTQQPRPSEALAIGQEVQKLQETVVESVGFEVFRRVFARYFAFCLR